MAKARKKSLPKDFQALLDAGDLNALKAVFDTHELEARGGYSKHTALSFRGCSAELALWLVAQGADIDARDQYARTALHEHAGMLDGIVATLLNLGADTKAADTYGDTPLHKAAKAANPLAVQALLESGADASARNQSGQTCLEAGLAVCSNIQIPAMVDVSQSFLADRPAEKRGVAGLLKRAFGDRGGVSNVTPAMRASVQRIGETFEFHRAGFNPDYVDANSDALDRLYAIFDVPPVARRQMHDGKAPITLRSTRWQDQHQELWNMLVPSKGVAKTVQGEVVRISGRMTNEVDRNGAINWDGDFGRMGQALLAHLASGDALPNAELDRAKRAVAEVRQRDGAGQELCELAFQWVVRNPNPWPLALGPWHRRPILVDA